MDNFFNVQRCMRCGRSFDKDNRRVQSWFNDDVICSCFCAKQEQMIINALPNHAADYEDCGYVPELKTTNLNEIQNSTTI